MSTNDQTHTSVTMTELALDVIDPDPENRIAVLDAAFKTSIATHGVLQPILVTPTEDGRYRIVAGERRWRASVEAGHPTIPATIRASDPATVAVWQAVENLTRLDLLPSQEAAAVARIMAAGMKQKALAAAVGKPQSWVRARIAIVALPREVQALIDVRTYEVSDALTLAKWADQPEVIARAADLDQYRELDWRLERAAALIEAEREVETLRETAAEHGWTVHEGWNVTGSYEGAKPLRDLDLDAEAHEAEACHLLAIYNHNATPYCTDPKRHSKKGESTLTIPPKTKPEPQPWQVKERDAAKAAKAAKAHRDEYVGTAIAARLRAKDVSAFVLPVMLATAGQTEMEGAAKVLGIEPGRTHWGAKDWTTPVREWAAASPANLTRAIVAVAYAVAVVHQHSTGDLLPEWLDAIGYDPEAPTG